jgi:hypothetical protein
VNAIFMKINEHLYIADERLMKIDEGRVIVNAML